MLVAQAVDAYTMTSGRILGSAAALVALAGAVVGGLALARRAGRKGSIVALWSGALGIVGGAFVLAVADGGPGTGNGVVGGYLALALGVAAVVLGRRALVRARTSA